MRKSNIFSLLLLLALTLSGCTSDEMSLDADVYSATRAQIQLNINTSGGTAYQSQLNELRLLMFDSETGDCVYNDLMTINSSEDLSSLSSQRSLEFDQLVIEKGTYDIVLLGNENSSISDLTGYRRALREVKNINDLGDDVFQKIPFKYNETGRGLSRRRYYIEPQGPLLLSAYQKNVEVVGGSRKEPQRIRATLVASLTLVDLVFYNGWEQSGVSGSPQLAPATKVRSIRLDNVADYYSNPAIIDLSEPARRNLEVDDINIPDANYLKKEIARFQFYIPEHITQRKKNATSLKINTKTITLTTKSEDYKQDLFAYDRLFNYKDNVMSYLNKIKNSRDNEFYNQIRNVRYKVEVYLLHNDQDFTFNISVDYWDQVNLIYDYNNEGEILPTVISGKRKN